MQIRVSTCAPGSLALKKCFRSTSQVPLASDSCSSRFLIRESWNHPFRTFPALLAMSFLRPCGRSILNACSICAAWTSVTRKLQTCKCKSNPNQKLQRNQPLCLLVLVVPNNQKKQTHQTKGKHSNQKKLVTLLDLCVSSLRRGRANLLCIVPILSDDPEGNPGFAAHGRPGLSNRECHWIAWTRCSAAWSTAPPAKSYSPTEQDRRARETRQQDSQDKQTNKRIQDKPTSNWCAKGGRKSRRRVCVWHILTHSHTEPVSEHIDRTPKSKNRWVMLFGT